ncbi:hypothetical protein BDB00DRAFT_815803 [Zychaea mexicana]|uniref:uncharacterized protein n=1 Tax=Zychaea mexicana TaxID=64656 RepID=UPI0022FF45F2|nr:uncharacterized protein BDB00DRAFT_815803 [Zychaea mexicana]KAI9495085.1 hypothetical protein BDB00DRAFT_815803 [Zychaea mexicana]
MNSSKETTKSSGESQPASAKRNECQLYELVQYQCEVGSTHIECNPFVRVFLRCTGKPTTEVTPEYDLNGDPVTNVLPDFGAVGSKKTPPGIAMMEEENN